MKQLEPKQVQVNNNTFYIFPFPAFKAANMSGQLISLVTPMLASLAPMINQNGNALDTDLDKAAPLIASSFSALSGDKLEDMLKKLLLGGNITVEVPNQQAVRLDEDTANEIFTGDTQDMFVLAFEVIKLNYAGFFTKVASQFGIQKGVLEKATTTLKSTVDLTQRVLQS